MEWHIDSNEGQLHLRMRSTIFIPLEDFTRCEEMKGYNCLDARLLLSSQSCLIRHRSRKLSSIVWECRIEINMPIRYYQVNDHNIIIDYENDELVRHGKTVKSVCFITLNSELNTVISKDLGRKIPKCYVVEKCTDRDLGC